MIIIITITPQGSVYLCKTPLENDYKNQLTFSSASAQQSYFTGSSVLKHTYTDFTYIKKDNQIVVGDPIDTIIDCNYLFYKNTGFTTKYYYCFITNMEYVNENATRITFETDVYQTYMFDISKKACLVEREHVNDDTVGANTVPEGLETGEFVISGASNVYSQLEMWQTNIYIGLSRLPDTASFPASMYGNYYGGVYSGVTYFCFKSTAQAGGFIRAFDKIGWGDNIVSVFVLPTIVYNPSDNDLETFTIRGDDTPTYSAQGYTVPMTNTPFETQFGTVTFGLNTALDGYTPKNNKLFTREFNYLYITNNAGSDVTYYYEDFVNNTPEFYGAATICPGGSIKLYPRKYKKFNCTPASDNSFTGVEEFNYGISCGKYPTCSWSNDAYTNWLTQNAVNFELDTGRNFVESAIKVGEHEYSGGEFLTSLVNNAIDKYATKQLHSFMPNQAKGNINSGDIVFSAGAVGFWAQRMTLRYEFAKRIDDFLSVFGYRVNEVKIPNITGRTYWNYVKTIDCNFEGDIPQMYLNKIKEIFNNGVTFWHDPTKFLDYTQNNTIVTPTP